jgi:V/A-type H+-transporting ATPase subunit I
MIGVIPGYWETDVSPFVLVFLSLFFGMIVGDAGYGLIFLGLTLAARPLMRKGPNHLFPLMTVMSVSTLIWGLLTGNFFGLAEPPGFLSQARVTWLAGANSQANLMFFCFLLGGLHLTLAHAIRLIRLLPGLQALAQLGWILITWVMFFAARTLVLMEPFPDVMSVLLPVGLILILAFMRPLRTIAANWTDYVRFPLDVISSFVDVVSYIRLFAVGTATFAVASAFNAMAADFGPFGILSGLAAGLILLLGHTLNILLAAMGVLVHGVRLNTLEFAGHAGIQWTGTLYSPFSRRARNISSSEPSGGETLVKSLDEK